MTRTIFDNDSVAHVWAQNERAEGRSHNGQFYFDGPAIYSYGSHYLVGFILKGVAFLNSDSNSMTTNRHRSRAAGAVSHRRRVYVPNLTALDSAFRWAARQAGDSRCGEPHAGQWGRDVAKRFRAQVRAWAVETYAARLSYGSLVKGEPMDSLAPVLEAFGMGRSLGTVTREIETKTAQAETRAARLEAEALEREARNVDETATRILKGLAELEPLDLEALKRANARLLKAQTWTKGRAGFLKAHARIRDARAMVRAEIKAEAARLERAEARASAVWGARCIRAGLATLEHGLESRQGTPHNPNGLHAAFSGGVWGSEGDAQGDGAEAQNARERAGAVTLAGVRAVLEGAPLGATMRGTLETLRGTLTPIVKETRDARQARAQERAEARERERMERERETRESWLAGDKAARFYGRDAQGGAYLRAVGVERDDSGAITCGTLETSQGANVPLAHALRVFRFLKHCRETGTPWHRNGRTIRVGFYQVDAVDSDGSFRAGCHRINWPQVAALAERLGVADLAPDSTVAQVRGAA
jgi:hypothetical protein